MKYTQYEFYISGRGPLSWFCVRKRNLELLEVACLIERYVTRYPFEDQD